MRKICDIKTSSKSPFNAKLRVFDLKKIQKLGIQAKINLNKGLKRFNENY